MPNVLHTEMPKSCKEVWNAIEFTFDDFVMIVIKKGILQV